VALTITELVNLSYKNAVNKGFWGDDPENPQPRNVGEMLMLIVSEVAEAMEIDRAGVDLEHVMTMTTGKPEGFLVELADVVIRVADLAGRYGGGQNFEDIVLQKMAYNESRPHKHGKSY